MRLFNPLDAHFKVPLEQAKDFDVKKDSGLLDKLKYIPYRLGLYVKCENEGKIAYVKRDDFLKNYKPENASQFEPGESLEKILKPFKEKPEFMYGSAKLIKSKNENAAIALFKRSASKGYAPAEVALGDYYASKTKFRKAAVYYQNAANKGNLEGMNKLALILQSGNAAQKKTAEELYGEAAIGGNADAQFNLGVMLYDKQNFAQAKIWFDLAAEQGHPGAAYNLGLMYEDEGDYKKAVDLYQQAADLGNVSAKRDIGQAQYKLALAFEDSDSLTDNKRYAKESMEAAAKNGYPLAKEWLKAHS